MLGLMQSQGLLIHMLLEHAQRHHGDTEIVSRRVEGTFTAATGPPLPDAPSKWPMLWTPTTFQQVRA
jgi:hypothetical protein